MQPRESLFVRSSIGAADVIMLKRAKAAADSARTFVTLDILLLSWCVNGGIRITRQLTLPRAFSRSVSATVVILGAEEPV